MTTQYGARTHDGIVTDYWGACNKGYVSHTNPRKVGEFLKQHAPDSEPHNLSEPRQFTPIRTIVPMPPTAESQLLDEFTSVN